MKKSAPPLPTLPHPPHSLPPSPPTSQGRGTWLRRKNHSKTPISRRKWSQFAEFGVPKLKKSAPPEQDKGEKCRRIPESWKCRKIYTPRSSLCYNRGPQSGITLGVVFEGKLVPGGVQTCFGHHQDSRIIPKPSHLPRDTPGETSSKREFKRNPLQENKG